MISTKKKMLRLGAALLAMGLVGETASAAQQIRTVYSPSQLRENPSAALSRHVRTLADSPRNVAALIGAGDAALALGDPQTALTFFARAEEVAPRDGRVKAGMGSAFVLLEQPVPALRFFGEAASLGIPEQRFAGDRGLAYDLTGDPRRAQADYRLALRSDDDPELRQRLALSLAISGDREGALKTIEDLVRKQDRSAWRTRAFILALTGDTKGATEATEAVMPARAAAMQPFYARLPWLTPAERANAVHFGRFPEQSQSAASAPPQAPAQYADARPATTQAGRADTNQPALGRARQPKAEAASTEARRRPGARDEAEKVGPASRAYGRDRSVRTAAAQPRETRTAPVRAAPQARSEGESEPSDPAPAAATPAFSSQVASAVPQPTPPRSTPQPERTAASPETKAPIEAAAASEAPEPVKTAAAQAKEPPRIVRLPFGPPTPGTPPRLADIREAVADIPEAARADVDEPAVRAPTAPSRHWVQIAGGANKDGLPREFNRLKERAPDLLSGRTAWTTPLRFTNRLLVGPFDSESEAQEFVNALVKADLAAFSWTSEEGQEIEKLPAR